MGPTPANKHSAELTDNRRSAVEDAEEFLPSRAEALMREYRLEEYGEMRPDLDRACAGYIVNALRRLGWDLVTGNRKHEDSLAKELGIVEVNGVYLGDCWKYWLTISYSRVAQIHGR